MYGMTYEVASMQTGSCTIHVHCYSNGKNTLNLLRKILSISFFLCCFSNIALAKSAYRIISLAPNLTEIVFAAGAGRYLIGVSTSSNFPSAAKKIPVVATYNDLDIERIISLKPNLIIAWKGANPPTQLNHLRKLGIAVYVASFKNILSIPKVALDIGHLAHTS